MYQFGLAPPHLLPGTPRFVVMGPDPAVPVPAGQPAAQVCHTDPLAGTYYGYFDCALQTPCPPAVCGGLFGRPACVRVTDTRIIAFPLQYTPAPCIPGVNTGMVFIGDHTFSNVGSQAQRRTIYVLNGRATIQGTVYGTLVVEGADGPTGCPGEKDVDVKSAGTLWAGPDTNPPGAGWGPHQYGYPLALLVYNPEMADPTILPTYAPQMTCTHMRVAGGNSAVNGLIYSGGDVLGGDVLNGGVVAFGIQTQGSASYTYRRAYGMAAPPPGFPVDPGNVVPIRKSFIVCTTYADDSGGATACP